MLEERPARGWWGKPPLGAPAGQLTGNFRGSMIDWFLRPIAWAPRSWDNYKQLYQLLLAPLDASAGQPTGEAAHKIGGL